MGLVASTRATAPRVLSVRPAQLASFQLSTFERAPFQLRLVSVLAYGRDELPSTEIEQLREEAFLFGAVVPRQRKERGSSRQVFAREGRSEGLLKPSSLWFGGEGLLALQQRPWPGTFALGCTDASSSSWALLQQVRLSKHPYKLKSRDIRHPHVVSPEHLPPPRYTEARLEGLQKFVPVNFYAELRADSAREGVFSGLDGCLSFNNKWKSWRRRKYNTKQHSTHTHASAVKGVSYLASVRRSGSAVQLPGTHSPCGFRRLHVFAVQWHEDGVHRIRWFRAAYGVQRAKRAAEAFRKKLEQTGRVDGEQTERQLMQKAAEKRRQLRLRKKLFAKISSGHF